MKFFRIAFAAMVWCLLNTFPSAADTDSLGMTPIFRKTTNGQSYTVFPATKFTMEFVTNRPSSKDTNIVLAIPAAFTRHDGKIDGVWMTSGQEICGEVNKELGGALLIVHGKCKMIATDSGATLTSAFLHQIQNSKGSLFQQFMIVENGIAASFKDKSKFQRRAIVEFTDRSCAVVESQDAMTFSKFNADLVELGVKNAIYTDMGAWDEGWYRDKNGRLKVIGKDRSLTHKQSNWLIYRAREKR